MTLSRESSTALIVSPRTGEALSLDSPTEDLARLLADVRDQESDFRELKRMVTNELVGRMKHRARWSLSEGGWTVKASTSAPAEEWDGLDLRSALLKFVDDGTLSIEAVDAAVETVVTYTVKKAGVNALRRVGGEIAATVDALCRKNADPERRVSVSRVTK